ncbi:glycosyl hydrolase family 17 protein [Rhodohalobacter sp.]|uniref:glycoside hydrolase family 17 protein n=1 Tax=Rhodohalobacter sp. TaxID=1974210 RepID=UPI002ACE2C20|nr:glycosyl hydrolase family 17 protein [Rhodohalobacter sp.]MDZ7757804.1 glycosyl hydrolase family 17 protein [Rhodohalobacter sp.]
MSYREEKYLSFKKSDTVPKLDYLKNMSGRELKDLFLEVLYGGIHGFCFSLYEEGQKPGDVVTQDQIVKRINILNKHSDWVRSFSCTEGNELIPKVAKNAGLKTLVGAWLGSDKEKNRQEIDNLVKLAREGYVDVAAVGNEVLYRDDLSEEELLEYIEEVKELLPDIPVGYVDAYYEFVQRPKITEACEIILCNCYPYWEGTDIQDSFQHMRQMYYQVKNAANGKRVMISETGWPNKGEALGNAVPTHQNAMIYFINTYLWANDEDVEVFYFSSFDESWKISSEGEVGAYWGIWDKSGKIKY